MTEHEIRERAMAEEVLPEWTEEMEDGWKRADTFREAGERIIKILARDYVITRRQS